MVGPVIVELSRLPVVPLEDDQRKHGTRLSEVIYKKQKSART